MDMNSIRMALQQEAARRDAGLGGSSAGIPGGAETTNAPSPANPLQQRDMTNNQPNTGNPVMPTAENPSAGATSALSKAQPGEAMFILKAMAQRLKQNPVQ